MVLDQRLVSTNRFLITPCSHKNTHTRASGYIFCVYLILTRYRKQLVNSYFYNVQRGPKVTIRRQTQSVSDFISLGSASGKRPRLLDQGERNPSPLDAQKVTGAFFEYARLKFLKFACGVRSNHSTGRALCVFAQRATCASIKAFTKTAAFNTRTSFRAD